MTDTHFILALPPLMDPKDATSKEKRIKHLRSMYRLFQQVERRDILQAAFKLFIKVRQQPFHPARFLRLLVGQSKVHRDRHRQ